MKNLRQALGLGSSRAGWRKLFQALERHHADAAGNSTTRLRENFGFGSNPGNLRMFVYRPASLAAEKLGCERQIARRDRANHRPAV